LGFGINKHKGNLILWFIQLFELWFSSYRAIVQSLYRAIALSSYRSSPNRSASLGVNHILSCGQCVQNIYYWHTVRRTEYD